MPSHSCSRPKALGSTDASISGSWVPFQFPWWNLESWVLKALHRSAPNKLFRPGFWLLLFSSFLKGKNAKRSVRSFVLAPTLKYRLPQPQLTLRRLNSIWIHSLVPPRTLPPITCFSLLLPAWRMMFFLALNLYALPRSDFHCLRVFWTTLQAVALPRPGT